MFLELISLEGPSFREPSEQQKFLQITFLLVRLIGPTNIVLSKLGRDRRLYRGENTCFRGF